MNIWVAILYGMIGGVTELLPVSFGAHASVLYRAFHLPSVFSGGGLYLRAAITLGLVLRCASLLQRIGAACAPVCVHCGGRRAVVVFHRRLRCAEEAPC